MIDLAAIRARVAKATPGPWKVLYLDEVGKPDEPHEVYGIESAGAHEIVKTDCGVYPPEECDAEFIAHAREDIPALLVEVERLQKEVDDWVMRHQERIE